MERLVRVPCLVPSGSLGWLELAAGCHSGQCSKPVPWDLSDRGHGNLELVGGKPALAIATLILSVSHLFGEQGVTASLPRQAGFQHPDVVVNRSGRKRDPGESKALLYSVHRFCFPGVPDRCANIYRGPETHRDA